MKLIITEITINKKDYDTEEIPILVIGPNNDNIDSINNYIDNDNDSSGIRECSINKYFANIQVGYYNINSSN